MNPGDEVKLVKWLSKEINRPFIWGKTDCNALVLRMLDHILGMDLEERYCSRYDSKKAAIEQMLGDDPVFLSDVLYRLGAKVIANGFQQLGDIVVAHDTYWDCAHIVIGKEVLYAELDKTVITMPFNILPEPYTILRVL